MADDKSMRERIWESLRSEMHFLKNCQIQYFVLSVAAAGVVASFGPREADNEEMYLAPLLVVIPCWWIFFDKATTISRIVAYLRHVERAIREGTSPPPHGWETALGRFREVQSRRGVVDRSVQYCKGAWFGARHSLLLLTTHKYWSINYYTFLLLSVTLLHLAHPAKGPADVHWRVAASLVAASAFHNLSVMGRLTHGMYSYDECYKRWNGVFADLDEQAMSARAVSCRCQCAEEAGEPAE